MTPPRCWAILWGERCALPEHHASLHCIYADGDPCGCGHAAADHQPMLRQAVTPNELS